MIRYDKIGFSVWRFEFCACFDMDRCSGPVWSVLANRFWGHALQWEFYISDWLTIGISKSIVSQERINRISSLQNFTQVRQWPSWLAALFWRPPLLHRCKVPDPSRGRLKGLEAGGLRRVNICKPKRPVIDGWTVTTLNFHASTPFVIRLCS